jgi:hypothetical protein
MHARVLSEKIMKKRRRRRGFSPFQSVGSPKKKKGVDL